MSRASHDPAHRNGSDRSSKEIYETLLRVVDYQTTGPDGDLPAGVKESTLYGILIARGRLDHDETDRARRAALENDDLLRWRGSEGRMRYAIVEEDALRDVIEEQARRENPNTSLIGRCNQLIADLRGNDNE